MIVGERSEAKVSRCVLRGAFGKGLETVPRWVPTLLDLPTTNNQIKIFLKTQVCLNSPCEDGYAIHDFESDFSFGEYENLYDLNLLAIKLEQLSVTEKKCVRKRLR